MENRTFSYSLKLYELSRTPWKLVQKNNPSSEAGECSSKGCHQNHIITWPAVSASLTPGIHYLERQRCVSEGGRRLPLQAKYSPKLWMSAPSVNWATVQLPRMPGRAYYAVYPHQELRGEQQLCPQLKVSHIVGAQWRIIKLLLCNVRRLTSPWKK